MIKYILIVLLSPLTGLFGQDITYFENAFGKISSTLIDDNDVAFKYIVFDVENAYKGGTLSEDEYIEQINFLTGLISEYTRINELSYSHEDKEIVKLYAAIFKVFADTIPIVLSETDTLYHQPLVYDFDDIFGDKNWSQMFVTKLLTTGKGNCHSLPYLYKIIAEELNVQAHLALAPNHVYIKHQCKKAGWYNTELISASFPIDAWIMASGYVHLDAIRNGVYMKPLSEKESVAMCLVDLAMGFDRKYPNNDGEFVSKCCDLALEHFPDYINGLMLKAETYLRLVKQKMATYQV